MSNLYDAIIVGGGPAGLSAAIYLARAKFSVLVIEKEKIGGQITITSEVVNYPGILQTSGQPNHQRCHDADHGRLRTLQRNEKRCQCQPYPVYPADSTTQPAITPEGTELWSRCLYGETVLYRTADGPSGQPFEKP